MRKVEQFPLMGPSRTHQPQPPNTVARAVQQWGAVPQLGWEGILFTVPAGGHCFAPAKTELCISMLDALVEKVTLLH